MTFVFGSALISILNETNFMGVSGRVNFTGPSRSSDIIVYQWVNKVRRRVAVFPPLFASHLPTNYTRFFNKSNLVWLTRDGREPQEDAADAGVACVLESLAHLLRVDCQVAIIVANILGFGVFAALLVVFFFFLKQRYFFKFLF